MSSPVEIRRVTKRLVMTMCAFALVWYAAKVHRDWVWAYFATLLSTQDVSPSMQAVATESIAAITTIAITTASAVTALAIFFVTGNVAALSAMFKFNAATNAAASVAAQATSYVADQTFQEELERGD
jgi:hypothetical protein